MGKPAQTFEDLIVWQKARRLVLAVYRMYLKRLCCWKRLANCWMPTIGVF